MLILFNSAATIASLARFDFSFSDLDKEALKTIPDRQSLFDARTWLWLVINIAAGLALLLLLFTQPAIRRMIAPVEPFFAPALLLGTLSTLLIWWIRPAARPGIEAASQRLAPFFRRWGCLLCILVFGATASGVHPAETRSLETRGPQVAIPASSVFGSLPTSDAGRYYRGACRLILNGKIDSWNTKRPLNSAFLATRMFFSGGNLSVAILLQIAVVALATWIAVAAVGSRRGVLAGLLYFTLLYAYARIHAPTTLSEPLGFSFGALAFAALVSGRLKPSMTSVIGGLLLLSLAEGVRPGLMFILLALIGWAGWTLWRSTGRTWTVAAALIAVLIGVPLINKGVNKAFSNSDGAANYNFALTLCGLARGTDWAEAGHVYGDDLAKLNWKYRAEFLYQKSWQHIVEDPTRIVNRSAKNLIYGMGALAFNSGAMFIPQPRMIEPASESPAGNPLVTGLCALALIPLLVLGGLSLRYLKTRGSTQERLFWLAVAVGALLSIPVVYADTGFRIVASTYPLLAGFLLLGIPGSPPTRGTLSSRQVVTMASVFAALIVVSAVATAATFDAIRTDPAPSEDSDEFVARVPGETFIIEPARLYAAILVADDPVPGLQDFRRMTTADFLRRAPFEHGNKGEAEQEAWQAIQKIEPPFFLGLLYDRVNEDYIYVTGPPALLEGDTLESSRLSVRQIAFRWHEVVNFETKTVTD